MLIPQLPPIAIAETRSWPHPVLQWIVEPSQNPDDCPNCSGYGAVYLKFTKAGPYRSPIGGLLTWFDGDEKAGKGWYVVDHTSAYLCPVCKKGWQS